MRLDNDTGLARIRRTGRDGCTLPETVIAIMILAICITGICGLLVLSRESSDRARWHYTAANIGKNRLERAMVAQYSELAGFAENGVVVDPSGQPSPNGDYRRTTTVSNATPSLQEMVVTVNIRNRITRSFAGNGETVRTYFANFQSNP